MQIEATDVLRRYRDELAAAIERAILAETQVTTLQNRIAALGQDDDDATQSEQIEDE